MAKAPAIDTTAMKELKAQIRTLNISNFYVFCGDEVYLREFYLGQLQRALLPEGLETFNLHRLTGKDTDVHDISRAVDCLPMMGERTMIVVTDYDLYKAAEAEKERLLTLLRELPDYVCLVFVYDVIAYKPDARTTLAGALKGHVVPFNRQAQGDLTDWIHRRFAALGCDIDTETARYLIFLCGDLMTSLASEIGKIGSFTGKRRVTKQDIDAVAAPVLDAVVFALTDAIARRNYDAACGVLGELLAMQEAPIMILSVLGKQLRQLYSARLAIEGKLGTDYLVALWKMHPYPADKLLGAAERLSLEWCRRAVVRTGETDLAMKSGGGDPPDLLITLLMELANG